MMGGEWGQNTLTLTSFSKFLQYSIKKIVGFSKVGPRLSPRATCSSVYDQSLFSKCFLGAAFWTANTHSRAAFLWENFLPHAPTGEGRPRACVFRSYSRTGEALGPPSSLSLRGCSRIPGELRFTDSSLLEK